LNLKPIERRLLEVLRQGHPDREVDVVHDGAHYRAAPFTWHELTVLMKTDDDAMGDAVAAMVDVGAIETARRAARILRWLGVRKAVTFYFITQEGQRWLSQHDDLISIGSAGR